MCSLKISHVVPSIEAKASGPSYSVPKICESIAGQGHQVELLTTARRGASIKSNFHILKFPTDFNFLGLGERTGKSANLKNYLIKSQFDILHSHGLWMLPNVYPIHPVRKRKIPLIISPRGMLGEAALEYSKIKKSLFWHAYQKRCVDSAYAFHATSHLELEDIRRKGFKQPVIIIPNGVSSKSAVREENNKSSDHAKYVLSLGRVHPKKGLDRLIESWDILGSETRGWQLKIVGPDEGGHLADLQRMVKRKKINNILFGDSVFGDDKDQLMAEAELFALPTRNDNFALTVAESLQLRTPVIASTNSPWSGLEDHGCGWWTDCEPLSLSKALSNAMRLTSEQRSVMGLKGQKWMESEFGWREIGVKMIHAYTWILGRSKAPDFVEFS